MNIDAVKKIETMWKLEKKNFIEPRFETIKIVSQQIFSPYAIS